jgi:hypothetical protein
MKNVLFLILLSVLVISCNTEKNQKAKELFSLEQKIDSLKQEYDYLETMIFEINKEINACEELNYLSGSIIPAGNSLIKALGKKVDYMVEENKNIKQRKALQELYNKKLNEYKTLYN